MLLITWNQYVDHVTHLSRKHPHFEHTWIFFIGSLAPCLPWHGLTHFKKYTSTEGEFVSTMTLGKHWHV
jgi:hypothetical protein